MISPQSMVSYSSSAVCIYLCVRLKFLTRYRVFFGYICPKSDNVVRWKVSIFDFGEISRIGWVLYGTGAEQ